MSTRFTVKMPTPLGVGQGQVASVQLPLGMTYERLLIVAKYDNAGTPTDIAATSAAWGAQFDDIRLIVDGDTRIEIAAADLFAMNAYYGIQQVGGVLPLFLSQPNARTIDGEDSTAYGTASGMSSFTLEMEIKSDAAIHSIEVYAMQSPPKAFGPHLRIQRHVLNQGVTGEAQIADIPRGPWVLKALHFTTAAIEGVELKVDNRSVYDTVKAVRTAQAKIAGKNPQNGYTHIDVLAQNRVADSMPLAVRDFRVIADFTATGNFAFYAETIRGAS